MLKIDLYRKELQKNLPYRLSHLCQEQWIPWTQLQRRHGMSNSEPLLALFKSYEHILGILPVKELAQTRISGEALDCARCGMCCAFMRPGPVSFRTWGKWQRKGALIADFFRAFGHEDNPAYHCWYFTGVRLRMCPLLLRSVVDKKTFCAVHHMGSTQRHPACSTYRPNPPLCRATAYSLEN